MTSVPTYVWAGFIVFVLTALALDLGVFHRKARVVGMREALTWSVVWISLAAIFNIWIYNWSGPEDGLNFTVGYLIELSLSVDNLFVFIMIFAYFRVPHLYQHKVLFWGILGALIMRAIFIGLGVTLITRFSWVMYVFGAFLIYTGIKMALHKEQELHPEKNPVLRLFRHFVPSTREYVGGQFFVREGMKLLATPLFIVLLFVETTDLIFAVDSVPAILAITQKPFIVYTSNVFAILGLRSFFFALSRLMSIFHFLHYGVSLILVFVGMKMLFEKIGIFHIYPAAALGVIIAVLFVSILASVIWPPKKV